MVRCKFKCVSKKEVIGWSGDPSKVYEFEFKAVTSGSPENEQFFKYTPTGSLTTGVVKEDAFEVGKEYYLDISEAVPVEAAAAAPPA